MLIEEWMIIVSAWARVSSGCEQTERVARPEGSRDG
jgi:hypothetical protein